jgi:predicted NBD/HSP70 family sugar kinase
VAERDEEHQERPRERQHTDDDQDQPQHVPGAVRRLDGPHERPPAPAVGSAYRLVARNRAAEGGGDRAEVVAALLQLGDEPVE